MFYVLGHDENGRLIAMTNLAFAESEAATAYADSCNQSWTPFVVESLPKPTREGQQHEKEAESKP